MRISNQQRLCSKKRSYRSFEREAYGNGESADCRSESGSNDHDGGKSELHFGVLRHRISYRQEPEGLERHTDKVFGVEVEVE